MTKLIDKRRMIHGLISALVLILMLYFNVSIWIIAAVGSATGIIFGKIFCRWMCPMGFLMELMMKGSSNERNIQLYNYHKLGCPIAWISGLLNRFSVFRIKREAASCTNCGICDKACYITALNKDCSLYKKDKLSPSSQFSCSKCLACVAACSNKSIKYSFK
ncbi:MAG: 4Fe-4S binding protein [Bacillota bacterium]